MGANGQTGGKNRNDTFVLTAFISFGLFNSFPVFDWPIIMIDPDGLLLVVPHLFAIPSVSLLGMGLQKKYMTKLGCENICGGSHTAEHPWRCSALNRVLAVNTFLVCTLSSSKGNVNV